MRSLDDPQTRRRQAPAIGRFGIDSGEEPRPYHPLGCPSLEQFEERMRPSRDEQPLPKSLS